MSGRKNLQTIILSSLLAVNACSTIRSEKERQDLKKGYEPQHVTSCAPTALKNLYDTFGNELEKNEISKEILSEANSQNNLMRSMGGLISKDALGITFPDEVRKNMEKRFNKEKYEIIEIRPSEKNVSQFLKSCVMLKKEGIILTESRAMPVLSFHWETIPDYIELVDYNTEYSKIHIVYLIREKSPKEQ